MSSHHIVRENQEPGLFIWDLDGVNYERFADLLEWNPKISAPYTMAELLSAWKIFPDLLVTSQEVTAPPMVRVLTVPADSSLESSVLTYYKANEFTHLNIVHGNPESVIPILEEWNNAMGLELFSGEGRYYPIKKGFTKWFKKGTVLKVVGANNAPCWIEEDGIWEYKTSNTAWLKEYY